MEEWRERNGGLGEGENGVMEDWLLAAGLWCDTLSSVEILWN